MVWKTTVMAIKPTDDGEHPALAPPNANAPRAEVLAERLGDDLRR